MLTRFLAAVSAAYIVITFLLSLFYKSSIMPMLFSSSIKTAWLKALVVVGLTLLATRASFKYQHLKWLAGAMGVIAVAAGLYGLGSVNLQYQLYPYLTTMDFLIALDFGILLLLASLSYSHEVAVSTSHLVKLKLPYDGWKWRMARSQLVNLNPMLALRFIASGIQTKKTTS